MATYDYKGDNSPDGTIIGKAATNLVAFHGSTPVDQYSYLISVGVSFITTSLGFGYTTSDQAIAIPTAINTILALLREKGLMASA